MTPGEGQTRRRVLLFITYYFDAGVEIGAVRPRAVARFLPENGWLPVVLTAGDPADDITTPDLVVRHVPAASVIHAAKSRLGIDVRTDRPARRRLFGGLGPGALQALVRNVGTEIGGIVPDAAAWAMRARSAGFRLVREYPPEVIYSSSPSHVANLVAWSLAGRARRPWVAELRDLWAQRPYRSGTRLRRIPDRILEPLVFHRARALVTVSEPLAVHLRRLHRGKRIVAIASGTDPDLIAPPDGPVDDRFTILYAGRIYESHQDLGLLLRPLRAAIDRGAVDAGAVAVELLLLHPLPDETLALIAGLGLRDVVHVGEPVARDEVIRRERRAQLLLHLRWDDPSESGIVTGKLFEYLAARRPILSTGRYRDDVVDLLERTGAGAGPTDDEATIAFLAAAFAEYRVSGRAAFHGRDDELAKLDVRGTTRAIAGILEDAANTAGGRVTRSR